MAEKRSHPVILGAGIAGLLTARVLSEFYESVTVVERDVLPDGPEHRRGVPQGRHLHNLLSGGIQLIGELFPGLWANSRPPAPLSTTATTCHGCISARAATS